MCCIRTMPKNLGVCHLVMNKVMIHTEYNTLFTALNTLYLQSANSR